MKKPEVVHYGDGHYHQMIYGLGPYIADYPEQVLLACVVQGWCPQYVKYCLLSASDFVVFLIDVMHIGAICR